MSWFLIYDTDAAEYYLTLAGYGVLGGLMLLALALPSALSGGEGRRMPVKQLVYCSVSIALAMVTSFIKFTALPFGGSVTLFSMFFICFTGFLYGPGTGLMTGAAYGMLQLLMDPHIYAPVQVLLDYLLAFGALGLSGFFWKSRRGLIKGCVAGMTGRYLCHVVSGYVFFAEYTPQGMHPLLYSLGYNATYIFPEMIATLILLSVPAVSGSLNQIKRMEQTARF